ncbi:MAG: transposase DNA-binding-containing protein [Planctomycetota bacterium]|nr:transposase DNA-binding-containing protein [Planctomycetota bacterium]
MQANRDWAQMNFGTCELADKRRTRRLVELAAEVANNPAASFPDQMPTWSDLKAADHLFDCGDVTFEAVAGPHWEQTKQCEAGRYLVIGDTTELDFGRHRDVPGLGPTGNGGGLGFLLHNGLLVAAESNEVMGVAGQTIHYRPETKASK